MQATQTSANRMQRSDTRETPTDHDDLVLVSPGSDELRVNGVEFIGKRITRVNADSESSEEDGFKNTGRSPGNSNEVQRIGKSQVRERRVNHNTFGDVIEKISKSEFMNGKAKQCWQKMETGGVRESKCGNRQTKRHRLEAEIEIISGDEFHNRTRQDHIKEPDIVHISQEEFRDSRARHPAQEITAERVSGDRLRNEFHGLKEEFPQFAGKGGHTYQHKVNEFGDNDDETDKKSASMHPRMQARNRSNPADANFKSDGSSSSDTSRKALHLQEDKTQRSHGSGYEKDHLGVASQTRSKCGVATKPLEVENISPPCDSRSLHSMASSDGKDDRAKETVIKHVTRSGFQNSRLHRHAEEVKVERVFKTTHHGPEEEFSQFMAGSSGEGHTYLFKANEHEDSDDESEKGSAPAYPSTQARYIICPTDAKCESAGLTSSETGRKSLHLQEDVTLRSHGSGHGMDQGVSSRTRSKRRAAIKPLKAEGISSRFDSRFLHSMPSSNSKDDRAKEAEIEHITQAKFLNSIHHHSEELKVQRVSADVLKRNHHGPEEEFSQFAGSSSGKGHTYQRKANELKDSDDESGKESASAYPSMQARNRSSPADANFKSNGWTSSDKRSRTFHLQEDETRRSHGSGYEMDQGVASRTRSKREVSIKPLKAESIPSPFDNISLHSVPSSDSEGRHTEEAEIEHFTRAEFQNSKIHQHAEEVKVERVSGDGFKTTHHGPVEEFSQFAGGSSGQGHTYQRKANKLNDRDDEAEKESAPAYPSTQARNRSSPAGAKCESNGWTSSETSRKTLHLEEDETWRSYESGYEMDQGVSSQIRSKRGVAPEPLKVENIASDFSDGSWSPSDSSALHSLSPSDSEADDEDDEDFTVEQETRSSVKHPSKRTEGCAFEAKRHRQMEENAKEDGCQARAIDLKSHKRNKCSSHAKKEENEDSSKTYSDLDDHIPISILFGNKNVKSKSEENEQKSRKHAYPQKDYGFYKDILDSVLDEEAVDECHEEAKQSCEHEKTFPLKFRFEDEVTKPVEKSQFDLMVDGLFHEMECCLQYGDMGFSGFKQVGKEYTNTPDEETNQYDRCCKGKHHLIEDDELGLICSYCFHVKLEAKHIMPPWAKRTYRGADRRPSAAEQSRVLDGLNLKPQENFTGICSLVKGTVWEIKPGIRETMYEHQQEGFEFLWKNLAGTTDLAELKTADPSNIGGCIISHAPGTGKTRLTMVFIETYLKLFPHSQPLIIAPASMLLTWEEEFRKWEVEFPFQNLNNLEVSANEMKMVQRVSGGKSLDKDTARMLKIYSWSKEQSILGMSYCLFGILAGKKSKCEPLRKILLEKPGLVVLDEGHTPRSRRSNIWNALLKLETRKRIILSGTPFQNNFEELFNILRIVRPDTAGALATERRFAEMIASRGMMHWSTKHESVGEHTNSAIEALKTAMAPFVHVHKGTILQKSLPGLKDCVVLLRPPPLQKSLIERIERSTSNFKFDYVVALISAHPYLFKSCPLTEAEENGVDQAALEQSRLNPIEGAKTRFVMEVVRLSTVRNEKVLLFSQYIKPLWLIQSHLKTIFGWAEGKQILKMQGRMGQKERQNLINAFNDPKNDAKVLLASTKCCSEGISLVGASRVVLLDVVWNPSVERQAISRAYRLGQKKLVNIYHLMTSGATEGDKYCRQAEKARLSELVFTSSSYDNCNHKNSDMGIEDEILEDMVADVNLKDLFEKIIYQPKEKNLVETFCIAS